MKTKSEYSYSILGEKPHKLNTEAEYEVIAKSEYFKGCVIIKEAGNDERYIVPESSMY